MQIESSHRRERISPVCAQDPPPEENHGGQLQSSADPGEHARYGRWSRGQVFEHVTRRCSGPFLRLQGGGQQPQEDASLTDTAEQAKLGRLDCGVCAGGQLVQVYISSLALLSPTRIVLATISHHGLTMRLFRLAFCPGTCT